MPRRPAPGGTRRSLAVLALLSALALLGCPPRPLLPTLVASSPAAGDTVARSHWPVLDFAAAVPPRALDRIYLFCGGTVVSHEATVLPGDRVAVNPQGAGMPAGASCEMRLRTVDGLVSVPFQTATAGAPFLTRHDRRDRNQPLPFPDDTFLVADATTATGLRPDVTVPDHASAVQNLLSKMATVAARADGWSPIGPLSVELAAMPDPTTLPADPEASLDPLSTVALLDVDPASPTYGQRVPFQLVARNDALSGVQTHVLVVSPGVPLEPLGRYGLVVTNRVLDGSGEPLAPSAYFDAVLGPAQPGEAPEIAAARPYAREVLDAAAAATPPLEPEDVALAVRLTVRSVDAFPADLLAMRDDVLATPPNVTITGVTAGSGAVAAQITGTFDTPDWGPPDLPFLTRDGAGVPAPSGTRTVDFVMRLPDAAATVGHAPILLYQHGNPGSAESEVPGAAGRFAPSGFAVAGFTDVLNRSFSSVENQNLAIFAIVLQYGDVPELYVTGVGEQLAFLHALRSLGSLDVLPLGAPDGVPDLDPDSIVYEGISFGGVYGQGLLTYAPEILAGSLVVGAFRFAEALEYQDRTTPLGGDRFLVDTLPTFVSGTTFPDVGMGLGLFASIVDDQDPHNHARFRAREPVAVGGSLVKPSVLVIEGLTDSFTSNNATRSQAWQLGPIPQVALPLEPVSYLPQALPPVQANVDASTTAAMVQYAPDGLPDIPPSPGCAFQFEGHYCAQNASVPLRREFYESAVQQAAPVIDP